MPPLAQLGTILQVPNKNPEFVPFGEKDSITQIWKKWCLLWEPFQKRGKILTFQQVNHTGNPLKVNPENRFRTEDATATKNYKTPRYQTFADFGCEGCQVTIGKHKTEKSAENQFLRIWQIYGRYPGQHLWLVNNDITQTIYTEKPKEKVAPPQEEDANMETALN